MVGYSQIKQQKELVKLEAQNLIDNVGHGLAYNFLECPRNCKRTALQNQIVTLRYHLSELSKLIGDWDSYAEDD